MLTSVSAYAWSASFVWWFSRASPLLTLLVRHLIPIYEDKRLIDKLGNYVNSGIWTAVEPSMGVVSACLPSLRPLFKMIVSGTYKGPTFLSRTAGKSAQDYSSGTNFSIHLWSRNKDHGQDLSRFTRLEEQPANEPENAWGHIVHVDVGGNEDNSGSDDLPTLKRQIRVKTEVTLISSQRLEYRDELY